MLKQAITSFLFGLVLSSPVAALDFVFPDISGELPEGLFTPIEFFDADDFVNPEDIVIYAPGSSNPTDSDGDGISDFDEVNNGTNPLVAFVPSPTVCAEWNGFLSPMTNVLELTNSGDFPITGRIDLFNAAGEKESTTEFKLAIGSQLDTLVHELKGFEENTVGQVCVTHDGNDKSLNGRIVYYKQDSDSAEIQFAFPIELTPGNTGEQFVTFNTFQPSSNIDDSNNIVANWIQLSNISDREQTGELICYGIDGSILNQETVTISAGGRKDFGAHNLGSNLVGIVQWIPSNSDALFQFRNIRYFYDNAIGLNSFSTAFQLPGQKVSEDAISVALDTEVESSIIEISNTSAEETSVTVFIFNDAGENIETLDFSLGGYATRHIVTDKLLGGKKGVASINGEHVIATVMQYGRTETGSLSTLYGVNAKSAHGGALTGSYNTFLNQGCTLRIVNETSQEQTTRLVMRRSDGTLLLGDPPHIFSGTTTPVGEPIVVPANGLTDFNLCEHDKADNYGTITLTPNISGTVSATVIRHGENSQYTFPTNTK